MNDGASDTSVEAQEVVTAGLRRMTGAERLARAFSLRRTALALARVGIRARAGGEISEREMRLRLASSWLNRETMCTVFAWDPAEK